MKFAAIIEYGPDPSKIAEIRPAHRKYLAELSQKGKLAISGPFSDDSGALIVYEVDSQQEAENMLKADPFSTSGVFGAWVMRPWNIVFSNSAVLPG
jgi:uncharacterized protein